MGIETVLIDVGALVASALLTGMVRSFAISHGVIDVPNERSSHVAPTPRGGGIAIVLATTATIVLLAAMGSVRMNLVVALTGGGLVVAAVGFLDDRRRLSARIRIAVHFGAAAWALFWIGGLPAVLIGDQAIQLGCSGYVLAALGIVWMLNLFNFMDGIDGIASIEAVFIAWAGALVILGTGDSAGIPAVGFALGAACCGFLLWNWPPAKIFMGDVGSGYLGYVIAVLGLAAAQENAIALLVWLILGAVFIVDATVTLVRRLARGERVHEAHRSHAYQLLARRWRGHFPVTAAVTGVNLLWLLPLAWLVTMRPDLGAWLAAVALSPLIILALTTGAGGKDDA